MAELKGKQTKSSSKSRESLEAELLRLKAKQKRLENARIREKEKALKLREKALEEREKRLRLEEEYQIGSRPVGVHKSTIQEDDDSSSGSPFSFKMDVEKVRHHQHIGDNDVKDDEEEKEEEIKQKQELETFESGASALIERLKEKKLREQEQEQEKENAIIEEKEESVVNNKELVEDNNSKIGVESKVSAISAEELAKAKSEEDYSKKDESKVSAISAEELAKARFEKDDSKQEESKVSAISAEELAKARFEKDDSKQEESKVSAISAEELSKAKSDSLDSDSYNGKSENKVESEKVVVLSKAELRKAMKKAKSSINKADVILKREGELPTLVRNKQNAAMLSGAKVEKLEKLDPKSKMVKKSRKKHKFSQSVWKIALLSTGVCLAVIGIVVSIIAIIVGNKSDVTFVQYELVLPTNMQMSLKDGERINLAGAYFKYSYSDNSDEQFELTNSNIASPTDDDDYIIKNGYIIIDDWGNDVQKTISIKVNYKDVSSSFNLLISKNIMKEITLLNGGYILTSGSDIPDIDLFAKYVDMEGRYKKLLTSEYRYEIIVDSETGDSAGKIDFTIDKSDDDHIPLTGNSLPSSLIVDGISKNLDNIQWWLVAYAFEDGEKVIYNNSPVCTIISTNIISKIVVDNVDYADWSRILYNDAGEDVGVVGLYTDVYGFDQTEVIEELDNEFFIDTTDAIELDDNGAYSGFSLYNIADNTSSVFSNLVTKCTIYYNNGGLSDSEYHYIAEGNVSFSEFYICEYLSYGIDANDGITRDSKITSNRLIIAKIPGTASNKYLIIGYATFFTP